MPPRLPIAAAYAVVCAALVTGSLRATTAAQAQRATRITWEDTAPIRARLEAHGLTSTSFASYVARVGRENAARVREGDLDHLVFYLLQSTHFTALPPVEPALSAKALVESLGSGERETFLRGSGLASSRLAAPVRSRAAALERALDSSDRDPRLVYFRQLVKATVPNRADRSAALLREYSRVMQFIYKKEFVAQRSGPSAVAELYRARGLSTDTEVEAGYLVYLGLGVVRSLDPDRRIRRVLIVGPGLDLAPRTALLETSPPESYQPWTVIDALLALGLSRTGDLEIVGADINPRVVTHLRREHGAPPTLTLVSGIRESDTISFSDDYRDYFTAVGRAIAPADTGAAQGKAASTGSTTVTGGHLRKTVAVGAAAARALDAETLDIVTERLDRPGFDLIIATNILPYFDDLQLTLAMTNIAGMLAPGGVLLHNEPRPLLGELTADLKLPLVQARTAVIATVKGSSTPLYDSAFIHVKTAAAGSR
ncbi:MAG: hypothetical protein ABJC89_14635 [Acidobacteriota bacterium]